MPNLETFIHAKAIEIGKLSVKATTAAGTGHPTSCLSLAHIITILMYRAMRWDPESPAHHGSDRLVLSEGHAVPIVYAACADIGVTFYPHGKAKIMDEKDLMTLRDIHSPIDGHPNPVVGFPLFDAATGSLGQGLSVAGGLAAAARIDKVDKTIYCVIGDGESREGQIWEAMDFIAEHELTNVVAIFNCNLIGQSDWVASAQGPEHIAAKAEAYGWKTVVVDGHHPEELLQALRLHSEAKVCGRPLAIIARTVKGWGAPTKQGLGYHGNPVSEKDLPHILAELDKTAAELGADKVTHAQLAEFFRIRPPLTAPTHKPAQRPIGFAAACNAAKLGDALTKKKLSPRRAFGLALDALGCSNPNVVACDADVKNSTYAQEFAKAHPSNYLECRIAEQNMVSVAAGLAAGGKVPFVSTFGKFLVRAFDQIEMAIISGANVKYVGTHIGVTLAADGPSQMALSDVAFMRTFAHVKDHRGNPAMVVLTAADAPSAYKMTLEMGEHTSSAYLRAVRADLPFLYSEEEVFPFGEFKIVRKATGKGKQIVLVATGYMVHSCLAVANQLAGQGIDAIVVDAYSLPFHTCKLLELAVGHGGKILTVEDNYLGGVASEIAEALAASDLCVTAKSLTVSRIPKSGKTPEDVLAYVHLSESDIAKAATALVG